MNADELIHKVLEGHSPSALLDDGLETSTLEEQTINEDTEESLEEGLDAYNFSYRFEELQSSISRAVAETRTLLKKCMSYSKQADPSKQKLKSALEKNLASLAKNLESAENDIIATGKSIDAYKENGQNKSY